MSQTAVRNPPPQIAQACQALGWTLIRVQHGFGRVAYLVEDQAGIVEPYSEQAILQSAAAVEDQAPQEQGE